MIVIVDSMLLYLGFGVTRLMASCRTSTRGLGIFCEYGVLWPVLDHFANHVWDGMLMMCMLLLWLLYFSVYNYSKIYAVWFNYLGVIDQYIVMYLVTFLVARWEPMDVMFYHMILFNYSWRTDVIMMTIFMVSLSRSCRIEMMLLDSVIWRFHV